LPLDGVGQLVPALLVDPDGLAFGDQTVGTTGSPLMLHLTNDGTADLHISAASAGDVNGSDFTLTGGSCLPAGGPVVVTPDESCDLQVRFRPSALGARTATVLLATNLPAGAPPIALSGTGTPSGGLTVDPTAVVFDPRTVDTLSPTTAITVSNTGAAPIVIGSVTLQGADAAEFGVRPGGCQQLDPGATCTVEVAVRPQQVGASAATLRVASVHGEHRDVALSATGVGARLQFEPATVDFGGWLVGVGGPYKYVDLQNTGNAPAHIPASAARTSSCHRRARRSRPTPTASFGCSSARPHPDPSTAG
jgi:hypothetical protein